MLANLSFETQGASPGDAASWTWNRSDSAMGFASFARPDTGFSRFDGFEFGWGVDNFIDTLVVPTNAVYMIFGTLPAGGVTTPFEDFERGWRLPNSHVVDPTHPGNETATFEFGGESAIYSIPQYPPSGTAIEGFERGWPTNENYFTSFTGGMLSSAHYATTIINPPTGQAFEDFEEGWLDNQDFEWSLGLVSALSPENFETVKADQTFTIDPVFADTFDCTAHGFSVNDKVTFLQGTLPDGTSGILPSGINGLLQYFVVTAGANTFKVSTQLGGTATALVDVGRSPCFVKADPAIYWTLTDVGV